MFAWIEELHNKLHKLDVDIHAEIASLKARIDALEGHAEAKPAEQPAPVEPTAPQN